GWIALSDLHVGDRVIGAHGHPVTVTGVYPQGTRPAYRVTFTDGISVVCDIEHLWAVNTRSRRHDGLPWRVLTLRQILAEGLADGEGKGHFVPLARPVRFDRPACLAEPVSLADAGERTGLTHRLPAARLGVSQSVVAHRETGRRDPPPED